MPLLLIPLLLLAVIALWALLLPFAMWQRIRHGGARRRAQAWVVGVNARLLLVSTMTFVLGAWFSQRWVDTALLYTGAGLAGGALLGFVGLRLTRFEPVQRSELSASLHYTPNRWLAFGLTVLVAARIALAIAHAIGQVRSVVTVQAWLPQQADLFAVGGLLLGHYLIYIRGLRARFRAAEQPGGVSRR